jgi:hypothetical protein
MNVKWLLETDVFQEGTVRLEEEIKRQGMEVKVAAYRPFDNSKGYLDLFDKDDCVVFYGSLNFVVAEDRVITGSPYKKGRMDPPTPEAVALAEKVAKAGYQPDPVWCVDVCRTSMDKYYVVEIGCFSCAGLYECDLDKIVREVSAIALRDWMDINNL